MMERLECLGYHYAWELQVSVNLALGSQLALVYLGSLDWNQRAEMFDSGQE